jgi:ribosome biogenesis SPOUT family RNA methylase Rps3
MSNNKTFIVEHLDPELEQWSALEYKCIARETAASGSSFYLTSVPHSLQLPESLKNVSELNVEHRGIEEIYADKKDRVCLLDPAATKELSPEDGDNFDIFLFGGILGDDPPRGMLEHTFGCDLLSNQMPDRTSELRKKGYTGRRLGPVQMTTDTAVRTTRIVVQDRIELENIKYVDNPEIKVDEHESTEMPFRYVLDKNGNPIFPDVGVSFLNNRFVVY